MRNFIEKCHRQERGNLFDEKNIFVRRGKAEKLSQSGWGGYVWAVASRACLGDEKGKRTSR
jgi:hypothetical protein